MLETFKTAAVNLPHPIASINYFIISIKKLDFLSGRQPAEREGKNPSLPTSLLPSRGDVEDDRKNRRGGTLSSRVPSSAGYARVWALEEGRARFCLGPGVL